jgi:hypothetical protein
MTPWKLRSTYRRGVLYSNNVVVTWHLVRTAAVGLLSAYRRKRLYSETDDGRLLPNPHSSFVPLRRLATALFMLPNCRYHKC